MEDYFFVAWNVYCGALAIYFSYFLSLAPYDLIAKSFDAGHSEQGLLSGLLDLVLWIESYSLECVFFILVVAYGMETQRRTLKRKLRYWWHRDFCRVCWNLRLIVLAVNLFIVSMVSWRVSVFILMFAVQSTDSRLVVDLLDSDNRAGLELLGHGFVTASSILLVRAMIGLLGFFDHTRTSQVRTMYLVGDLINGLYGLFAAFALTYFVIIVQRSIERALTEAAAAVSPSCRMSSNPIADCSEVDLLFSLHLARVDSWVINFNDFGFLIVVWLAPVILAKAGSIGLERVRGA